MPPAPHPPQWGMGERVLEHGNVTFTEAAGGDIFLVVLSQVLRNEGFVISREVEASIFSGIIDGLSFFIAFKYSRSDEDEIFLVIAEAATLVSIIDCLTFHLSFRQ